MVRQRSVTARAGGTKRGEPGPLEDTGARAELLGGSWNHRVNMGTVRDAT